MVVEPKQSRFQDAMLPYPHTTKWVCVELGDPQSGGVPFRFHLKRALRLLDTPQVGICCWRVQASGLAKARGSWALGSRSMWVDQKVP